LPSAGFDRLLSAPRLGVGETLRQAAAGYRHKGHDVLRVCVARIGVGLDHIAGLLPVAFERGTPGFVETRDPLDIRRAGPEEHAAHLVALIIVQRAGAAERFGR
jgi:hypothetical protein